MTKTMLIDASHAEETRVVVLENNRLDDFDIETADKKQIKGNIYLAKVIRVEPSLQAAFVEYGGNRHGFLAFSEIHPDYYQIPVADRQKLLELEAEEARRRVEDEDEEDEDERAQPLAAAPVARVTEIAIGEAPPSEAGADEEAVESAEPARVAGAAAAIAVGEDDGKDGEDGAAGEGAAGDGGAVAAEAGAEEGAEAAGGEAADAEAREREIEGEGELAPAVPPEQVGGGDDGAEEARERRRRRALRSYKIQEVIHRRQIILVQVVKEERGSKGAALTTYISLAGRFSVLMPNSPNGGGVSRKITSVADRRRLKEAVGELEIPEGMGMIVRTAGANRPKPEIKRDCEYLLRLWDDIRERTLNSIAPALVYEEATLIKRTIRDVYTRDVEAVLVEGEEGYRTAREFMRMLMPTHVKKIRQWTERQPLFAKYNVEHMLDSMFQPTVQLKSGGYLVINQTEALVAIDVNSGRATRERNIEDTALKTNLEAAEEVARQLRLRDLAGLIVVDFIDMEARRHNSMVERKLKEALRHDRARIQVGSISHFGLLEMSRQRLRPSLAETMLVPCPHCEGVGHVRSTASTALAVLRAIEDEGARNVAELKVHLAPEVALYIFNHKRAQLAATEARFGMTVSFIDDAASPASFKIEKLRSHAAQRPQAAGEVSGQASEEAGGEAIAAADEGEEVAESAAEAGGRGAEDGERRRRRRRRRRGGRREEGGAPTTPAEQPELQGVPAEFTGRVEATVPGGEAVTAGVEPGRPEPGGAKAEPVAEAGPGEAETQIEAGTEVAAEAETTGAAETAAEEAVPAEKPKRRATRTPRKRTVEPKSGRGGTRRAAKAEVPAEPAGPVFTDIADIFEAAEQAEASQPKPRRPRRSRVAAKAADGGVPGTVSEAVPESKETPEPDVGTAEAPEPVAEKPADEVPAPEAAAEPTAEPSAEKSATRGQAVQPVVIGSTEAPAERKRGWWKRTG